MYRLEVLRGDEWEPFSVPAVGTEQAAWELLAAWERYCPKDRFRWVRQVD